MHCIGVSGGTGVFVVGRKSCVAGDATGARREVSSWAFGLGIRSLPGFQTVSSVEFSESPLNEAGGAAWFVDGGIPLSGPYSADFSFGRDLPGEDGGFGNRNGGAGVSRSWGGSPPLIVGFEFG
jgi:hypothetical protein